LQVSRIVDADLSGLEFDNTAAVPWQHRVGHFMSAGMASLFVGSIPENTIREVFDGLPSVTQQTWLSLVIVTKDIS